MLNLAMLKWGLHRLWKGRSPDIRSVASRSWEICPGDTKLTRPALYPEGTLERIDALSPWRSWEVERTLITGNRARHDPSTAHLIQDVSLSGAFIYRGAAKSQPGFGPAEILHHERNVLHLLDEVHLMSNNAGSHFFGNFLLDDFPLGLIPEREAARIVMTTKPYEHEAGYRQIMSLERPPRIHRARIRRLILYTDYAQNSYKQERYLDLRARMRDYFRDVTPPAGPGIYIKRGVTGEARLMSNEAEVERLLGQLGFDIVEPAHLGAEEVARRSLDAPIVVSVEGSHLSHAIYSAADHGAFLVLQPPDRFAMAYKEFTDRVDMRFGFVIGHPGENGFRVDLGELRHMLDRLA